MTEETIPQPHPDDEDAPTSVYPEEVLAEADAELPPDEPDNGVEDEEEAHVETGGEG